MLADLFRSRSALRPSFALLLLVAATIASGCGGVVDAAGPRQTNVVIEFRSEKVNGKEVGLPWLEPAITRPEAAAMLAGFDWSKTTPVREYDADGSPALYYGVVYLTRRDQRELLDQVELHHSTMPLFDHERAKWHGQKGKVPQSTDGKGALVFAVVPGRIYNAIRDWAIAGDPLFPAIVLRDVPKEARNAEGSLSYAYLAKARFLYRGMAPIHTQPGLGTSQQKLVLVTARAALEAVAEAAEDAVRAVLLALGAVDRDGLLFGFGAAGTAELVLTLDVRDTDPAFGGTSMRRAWGADLGKPVMLPGVRVSVWSHGDSTVLDLPTLFEGTTDKDSVAVLKLAKNRKVDQLCIATENDAAEITDLLTEIDVCDFEGSVDRVIDDLKADRTLATVAITDKYFNILAQVTEGSAYLRDIVGYTPHKATIVVGWIADAMGSFGTGAPFTPCLGFPNLSADILVVDILGLIAAVPVVGPPIAVALAALTPLIAADMFFPDSDALDSRGAPTHEYGHFATCSMLYDTDVTNISTAWTNAVIDRISSGAVPGADASEAYDIEAFADFFAGQVAGGTNYFHPGTLTSGIMSFCDVTQGGTCLDTNYSDQSDFFAQVARVATTVHDAFDGSPFASWPDNASVWTQTAPGAPITVGPALVSNGDAFDEDVYLPGAAIRTFIGKIDTFGETKFMTSLADTMRENGRSWCQICRVFSLHAGVAASAPPADHFAACAAAPIASWVGPAPDSTSPSSCNFTQCPFPLVLTNGQCEPCAANQIAVNGTTCLTCPPGTEVVNDQCQTCIGRVCTPACPQHQQMVKGVCEECGPHQISVNGVCQDCAAGQYQFDNACLTVCPDGMSPNPDGSGDCVFIFE